MEFYCATISRSKPFYTIVHTVYCPLLTRSEKQLNRSVTSTEYFTITLEMNYRQLALRMHICTGKKAHYLTINKKYFIIYDLMKGLISSHENTVQTWGQQYREIFGIKILFLSYV